MRLKIVREHSGDDLDLKIWRRHIWHRIFVCFMTIKISNIYPSMVHYNNQAHKSGELCSLKLISVVDIKYLKDVYLFPITEVNRQYITKKHSKVHFYISGQDKKLVRNHGIWYRDMEALTCYHKRIKVFG